MEGSCRQGLASASRARVENLQLHVLRMIMLRQNNSDCAGQSPDKDQATIYSTACLQAILGDYAVVFMFMTPDSARPHLLTHL